MTATERINTKEELVKTRNGMKIQTITLPGKNIDQNNNQSEKHLVYSVAWQLCNNPINWVS
ncbi:MULTISPECIES: hypothetical protein [unclassified Wolbachia]|uniref:hypothetical protein n=1 Tax=unclassified Wolbachia TaxID=2640676 RepID=UPI0030CA4D0B